MALHEATHKLQYYLADLSDIETQDVRYFSIAARAFYDSTCGSLAQRSNHDLHLHHPLEGHAVSLAENLTMAIYKAQVLGEGLSNT